jgi:hypothetical protein
MNLILPTTDEFDRQLKIFGQNIYLETKLPAQVIRRKAEQKFVIGESGDFHKPQIFKQLGEIYGDRQLYYLMLDPAAKGIFETHNQYYSYSVSLDFDFDNEWQLGLRGFGFAAGQPKVWPWMIANTQCYCGSSEKWVSYHDNNRFELDIFCVPADCDILGIFGKPSWSYTDLVKAADDYRLGVTQSDLETLMKNYFF